MPELPTGTVTFLFSDVEGSTHLLLELGEDYAEVLGEHRRDPGRDRALLLEGVELATSLGRPDAQAHGLLAMIAARQGDRREAIEQSARAIELHFWFADQMSLGAMLEVLAHALADLLPEAAGVLQGACDALDPGFAGFRQIAELRQQTTRELTALLGEPRLDELRLRGGKMDEDHAVSFAMAQIGRALGEPG